MSSRPTRISGQIRPLDPLELKQLKVEAGSQVNVMIRPGLPVGQLQEELIIETDHPKRSEVRVTIMAKVNGPISVVPPGLRAHDITVQGTTRELSVLVRGDKETHFEVASAPEKIKVAVVPDQEKGRYKLTITVPPGTPPGKIEGEIVLKTDHPLANELKVPVDIFILRKAAE